MIGDGDFRDRTPRFSEETNQKLNLFVDEILAWNPRYKLLSRGDGEDRERIRERHILDSLEPLDIVADTIRSIPGGGPVTLYDLGSGAGLPGIPLALVFPEVLKRNVRTVLVERSGRRTRFLNYMKVRLGLERLEVFEGEITDLRAPADDPALLVFRALTPVSVDFTETLGRIFPEHTPVLAYKGRSESIRREVELTGGRIVVPDTAGSNAESEPRGVILRFDVG